MRASSNQRLRRTIGGDAYGGRTRSAYLSAAVNWSSNIRFSATPSVSSTHAAAQYAAQFPDPLATMTYGQRFVFADLDETTFGLSTRLDWTFTPQLTLQLYVQPFVGSGSYDHYAEFRSPRNFRFDRYGQERGTIERGSEGALSIDPDERPLGSLFAFPDPFDANYGRGGLARTMTARGWLSTWSGLSSHAKLADTMPRVTVPTLLVHPTADTEIRVRQAKEITANAGAADVTYVEMKGAPHYLEGHRPEAMAHVVDWLAKRYP